MTKSATIDPTIQAYLSHGWALVPLKPYTKKPLSKDWTMRKECIKQGDHWPDGAGVGLAHAYSGTASLDIDEIGPATVYLSQKGIDLKALFDAPDAVQIVSGKEGHGKLLYRMPAGMVLPSKRITGVGGGVVFEMRCATAAGGTVQDVLPPSLHPETQQAYSWGGAGHWSALPDLPDALMGVWCELLSRDREPTIPTDTRFATSWEEISQALDYISPDCSRDEWIACGMALHWAGSQINDIGKGEVLWREWSKGSDKYPGDRGIRTQWMSFKSEKSEVVKLGTLFHIAKEHGWQRPTPDVSSLFQQATLTHPAEMIHGLRPRPPEMDMVLWPDLLQRRAAEISDGMGCDPLLPLWAGLAAVCGAVDARSRLELMPGFKVPPVLWLMSIGAPADKKSPGSKPMFTPLRQIAEEDIPRYAKELLAYEGREAAYASSKKAFLEWAASPEALMSSDPGPQVLEQPKPPTPVRITISDVTSQSVVRQAADRPRGLLLYLDEMAAWVANITNPKSGENRSSWTVAYESDRYEMDRVGAGSIVATNYAVSIYGNIQPEVFKKYVKDLSSDGLLQRFIPCILRPDQTRLGHPVPEYLTSAAEWEALLRLVYTLPAQTYHMSTEAHDVFREFQAWYEDAKRDERLLDAGDVYMTAFGKLEGLAGRLILVWHIIESPFSSTVSADLVHRVVDLIKGYIIPAYKYTYSAFGNVLADSLEEWVIEYVAQMSGEKSTVSLKYLKAVIRKRATDRTDWQREQIIVDVMDTLEQSGWVVCTEHDRRRGNVEWAINPEIAKTFETYRTEIIRARQRDLDYVYRYSYAKGYDRKFVKGFTPEMEE